MFRRHRIASARRIAVGLAAVALAVGVAGCTHTAASVPTPTPTPSMASSGPVSTPTPKASASPTPTGSGDITLGFAGDVHFEKQAAKLLNDPATRMAPIRSVVSQPDIMMLNLETAITTRGTARDKEFTFRAPATAFDALRAAGVDVVTMANNHTVDFGAVGLHDTLAAIRDKHFPVVGLGADQDTAYAPYIADVNGVRVAFFGATQINDSTANVFYAAPGKPGVAYVNGPKGTAHLADAVKRVRPSVDVVVAFIHWGSNYTYCPNSEQKNLAGALADVGADVIVGAHSHVLQGGGWLGDTYVDYGLGNFVWWQRVSLSGEPEHVTGMLTVQIKDRKVTGATWQPADIQDTGLPKFLQGAAAARASKAWQKLHDCTGLAAAPSG